MSAEDSQDMKKLQPQSPAKERSPRTKRDEERIKLLFVDNFSENVRQSPSPPCYPFCYFWGTCLPGLAAIPLRPPIVLASIENGGRDNPSWTNIAIWIL